MSTRKFFPLVRLCSYYFLPKAPSSILLALYFLLYKSICWVPGLSCTVPIRIVLLLLQVSMDFSFQVSTYLLEPWVLPNSNSFYHLYQSSFDPRHLPSRASLKVFSINENMNIEWLALDLALLVNNKYHYSTIVISYRMDRKHH